MLQTEKNIIAIDRYFLSLCFSTKFFSVPINHTQQISNGNSERYKEYPNPNNKQFTLIQEQIANTESNINIFEVFVLGCLKFKHNIARTKNKTQENGLYIMRLFVHNTVVITITGKSIMAMKVFNLISDIRTTDARSKGVENSSATDADLLKELLYKILH